MGQVLDRLKLTDLPATLLLCISINCPAAIPVAITGAYVDATTSFHAEIVIHGEDSDGREYLFTCRTFDGSTPLALYGLSPGENLSPRLYTTSADFGNYSLSIDGIPVPVLDDSLSLGDDSYIEIDGPQFVVPSGPVVSQSLAGLVSFETRFNLFGIDGSPQTILEPTYVLFGIGFGGAEITITPIPDLSAYQVSRTAYQLTVPEPSSIGWWIALILGWNTRRRN